MLLVRRRGRGLERCGGTFAVAVGGVVAVGAADLGGGETHTHDQRIKEEEDVIIR